MLAGHAHVFAQLIPMRTAPLCTAPAQVDLEGQDQEAVDADGWTYALDFYLLKYPPPPQVCRCAELRVGGHLRGETCAWLSFAGQGSLRGGTCASTPRHRRCVGWGCGSGSRQCESMVGTFKQE